MLTNSYNKCLEECLNDKYQNIAINSDSHTIIKAGPGTGKTRILTIKAAKLLLENVEYPRGIACITYTVKAAQELKYRLNLYGISNRKNIYAETIHKFCLNNIIYPFSNIFSNFSIENYKIIIDPKNEMSEIQKHFNIDKNTKTDFLKLFKEYKYCKYEQGQEVADKYYTYYKQYFYSRNLLNFDLIMDIANDLIQNDYICKCIEAKYPYILIDEYQDSSIGMHVLFNTLREKTNIIFFIVGDPQQSIYGYSAASSEYFEELYDSDIFNKIELKNNYRTQNGIIYTANSFLINNNKNIQIHDCNCYAKKCNSLEEQIEYIIENILPKLKSKNILPKDICLMYRDKNSEKTIKQHLVDKNVKFVNNNKVYVNKEYKDSDIIIFLEDLIFWLLKENKTDKNINFKNLFYDYIKIFYNKKILSKDLKNLLKVNLYKTLHEYTFNEQTLLKDFLRNLNIFNLIKTSSNENIVAFDSFISLTNDFTIYNFYDFIESKDAIRITTVHSAKGLEFRAVIIPDLEDGRYPSWGSKTEDELNEERRLLFVALSRAKEYLFVLYSGYYIDIYNRVHKDGVSRFYVENQQLFDDCDDFI